MGAQELVNIMWSLGSLAYEPPTILFRELERVYQQMVDAGLFNTQVSSLGPDVTHL